MNPRVNRFNETPSPSEPTVANESDLKTSVRNHPIPPPSHPKQYRAIGLIQGCYTPAADALTKGTLKLDSGREIPAVLLGKTMSVLKNHLDLTRSHLWVVYPRMRQQGEDLHVQIAGVWEPEVLGSKTPTEDATATPTSSQTEPEMLPIRDGVFSIRGEVVFYDPLQQKVVVRIQQAPRRPSESGKDFKLTLAGTLPTDKPLRHFWDLQAVLQETTLSIEAAAKVGLMPPRKRSRGKSAKKSSQKPKKASTTDKSSHNDPKA